MTQATAYEHIAISDSGVALIEGTTMKVVELVLEMIAYGWSPDELQFQHPYLTLGQIHAALSYYWDHKDDFERDIERRLQRVERIRREVGPSSLVERLKSKGLLP
jgi:uncharacterized protein (DUF433 family)